MNRSCRRHIPPSRKCVLGLQTLRSAKKQHPMILLLFGRFMAS